jgi:histidyl-tRNA synthetase
VSIGVSRLLSVLQAREQVSEPAEKLVMILVLDKAEAAASFKLAQELREAGFRAEAYTGESGMKAQMKYADRRGAAIAIIEGSDERARGELTVKDLVLGAELAKSVGDRAEWVKEQPAQVSVARANIAASLRTIMDARKG